MKTVKTAGVQCISLVSAIMNSKNASKEIVKARIDMAKGLMDENQQPSVQRELERLFSSARGGERGSESR